MCRRPRTLGVSRMHGALEWWRSYQHLLCGFPSSSYWLASEGLWIDSNRQMSTADQSHKGLIWFCCIFVKQCIVGYVRQKWKHPWKKFGSIDHFRPHIPPTPVHTFTLTRRLSVRTLEPVWLTLSIKEDHYRWYSSSMMFSLEAGNANKKPQKPRKISYFHISHFSRCKSVSE